LSGGEKNRLVLAGLFLSRANFLVLDEPTNHLDMESREALIEALCAYSGTILAVAHDRYLLSEVVDEIWELTPQGIDVHQCGFDEYHARKKAEVEEIEEVRRPKSARQDQKQRKREEAELRNRIHRQARPLRQKYEKLEGRLEENLEEQGELEMVLADPATYEDVERAGKLGQRFVRLQEKAEELMNRLAYLEKELQELEEQKAD
jgi:ATP-binding cassette subfamily F protein 3